MSAAVTVNHITFDCADTFTLSEFWRGLTGFCYDPEGPNEPGDEEAYLGDPDSRTALLFVRVPEGKTVKNRLHLDLMPNQRTRDEDVHRILGLGGTIVEDHRRPDGSGWVTMADPAGNEFCVERSAGERTT